MNKRDAIAQRCSGHAHRLCRTRKTNGGGSRQTGKESVAEKTPLMGARPLQGAPNGRQSKLKRQSRGRHNPLEWRSALLRWAAVGPWIRGRLKLDNCLIFHLLNTEDQCGHRLRQGSCDHLLWTERASSEKQKKSLPKGSSTDIIVKERFI